MVKKIVKISLIVAISAAVLLLGSCAWLTYKAPQIMSEANLHLQMYQDVQEQLGFRYRIQYLKKNDSKKIFISEVAPGKLADQAGLKVDDQYSGHGFTIEFFNEFIFNQEKQITIPILRDGKRLDIVLNVPKLQLKVDPYELHYPFFKHSK